MIPIYGPQIEIARQVASICLDTYPQPDKVRALARDALEAIERANDLAVHGAAVVQENLDLQQILIEEIEMTIYLTDGLSALLGCTSDERRAEIFSMISHKMKSHSEARADALAKVNVS